MILTSRKRAKKPSLFLLLSSSWISYKSYFDFGMVEIFREAFAISCLSSEEM